MNLTTSLFNDRVIEMKKLLEVLIIGLLLCSTGYAKTKITEVKKSVNEDRDGLLLSLIHI